MAGPLTASAAPSCEPAGPYPGAAVVVQVGRKAIRSGVVWGFIFGAYVLTQTLAYTSAYRTQVARNQMARAFGSNIGLNALIGPAHAINTVAGYVSWRVLGIVSILGAVWGLLTATRLLRGEEETGRYELLLAGQTTRRRAAAQAVAGLGAGLAAVFVLTAVGTVSAGRAPSVGFAPGQSLYFSVTLVVPAAMFLAVGVLTSQLAGTRRQAAAMAGVALGICYALRMVADSDPRLHWIVWLSPLGWIEESRPLVGPRPLALLPAVLFMLILVAAAVHLSGRRDLGAATFPGRDRSAPHLALLGSPAGLTVRLMRPVALSWLFAVTAFAVLLGAVAESSVGDVTGDRPVRQALSRLGGHGSALAAYLGLTFLILALMIALVAAGQIAAIRTEESVGRLENFAVRPVSRTSWFAGRLLLSTAVLALAGVLAGVGAWAGAGQHGGLGLGPMVAAGLSVIPPSLLVLGLGALVFGVWPRATSPAVYAYLAWSFLIEFIGAVAHVSHWLLDTSVLFHLAPAPAASPDWASATVVICLAVAGAVVGGTFLSRRDVVGA